MDMTIAEHFASGERHLKKADGLAAVDYEAAASYSALARAHFDAARTARALGLDAPADAPDSPPEPKQEGPFFSWMDNGGIGDD
jgi:hypothetical protein